MTNRKFVVVAQWDEEARVWVATSDDIPGLVTEAPTLDELRVRVLEIAPELLEENAHLVVGLNDDADSLQLCVESDFRRSSAFAH